MIPGGGFPQPSSIGAAPVNSIALLHFDGTNGSTTITDVYGNTCAASGSAALSTSGQAFGTACLNCPNATTDYVTITGITSLTTNWTMECWASWASTSDGFTYDIFEAVNAGGYGAKLTRANSTTPWITMLLSSNGTSHNIASANSATFSIGNGTMHHFAVVKDASAGRYYAYADGIKRLETVSSTDICAFSNIKLGLNLRGKLDEFRASPVCRYPGGTTFTPSSSAFTY